MLSASADAKHVRLAISASGPECSNLVVATLRRLGITVLSRQTASAHELSASLRIGWYQRGFPTPIQPLQGRPAAGRVSDERLGDTRRARMADARCNVFSVMVSPERSQSWTRRLAHHQVMMGGHCIAQAPASRPSTSLLERHRAPKSGTLRAAACRPRLRLHPELEERPSVSLSIGPMGRVAC